MAPSFHVWVVSITLLVLIGLLTTRIVDFQTAPRNQHIVHYPTNLRHPMQSLPGFIVKIWFDRAMDSRYVISDGQPRGIPKGFPLDISSESDLTPFMLQIAFHFSRSGHYIVDPKGLIWTQPEGFLKQEFYHLLFERANDSGIKRPAVDFRSPVDITTKDALDGNWPFRFPRWVLAHNAGDDWDLKRDSFETTGFNCVPSSVLALLRQRARFREYKARLEFLKNAVSDRAATSDALYKSYQRLYGTPEDDIEHDNVETNEQIMEGERLASRRTMCHDSPSNNLDNED